MEKGDRKIFMENGEGVNKFREKGDRKPGDMGPL